MVNFFHGGSSTQLEIIQFENPETAREAALRSRRSIEMVLDLAEESLQSVQPAIQRFGREQIEIELGVRASRILKAYDLLLDLLKEGGGAFEPELS